MKKQLNLPDGISDKLFSLDNIPNAKEQIMFFDCPNNIEEFHNILMKTDAKIVHLMNFSVNQIKEEEFITKLSGMLKYALSHLNGNIDICRLASALTVDKDTIECALSLLENSDFIELERLSDMDCKIIKITPVELSKIMQEDLYLPLAEKISNINEFKPI